MSTFRKKDSTNEKETKKMGSKSVTKDNNNNNNKTRNQNDYLNIIEPFPVEPPEYFTTLPKTSQPSFSDFESKNEIVPSYQPTVYKLGILYRKMEWISPFEMATQRHWKPYIVELNSTQLNFYQCPFKETDPIMKKFDVSSSFSSLNSHSLLHPYHYHHLYLKKLKGLKAPSAIDSNLNYNYNEDNYRSIMTTKTDLKALKFFKSINALDSTKIIRSYSLQYGKIGLAIDYKKKIDVFRCRFETEQFLIDFPSTESMIEWYNSLNLGIDNSLDLNRREMPNYRTVPRRRRRRIKNHYKSLNVSMGLNLRSHHNIFENTEQQSKKNTKIQLSNNSNNNKSESGGLLNFLKKRSNSSSKLKSKSKLLKINGNNNKNIDNNNKSIINYESKLKFKKFKDNNEINSLSNKLSNTHLNNEIGMEDQEEGAEEQGEEEEEEEDIENEEYDDFNDVYDDDVEDDEVEDDELIDDDEDEFLITEDINAGDDERDSDIENEPIIKNKKSNEFNKKGNLLQLAVNKFDKDHDNNHNNNHNHNHSYDYDITSLKDYKLRTYQEYIAKPSPHSINTHTFPAQRKILRDSLRCMTPLIENERWVGKYVLLDFTKYYKPQSRENVDKHYQCLEVLTHLESVGQNYVHRFKRPLQEWIVTPSGLVPCINPNCNR